MRKYYILPFSVLILVLVFVVSFVFFYKVTLKHNMCVIFCLFTEVTCNVTQQADILFILDASGSIGPANYSVMLNFVVDITRNFKLGPNGIQFASIIFGTDVQEVFAFTTYTSQSTLEMVSHVVS